jgi:hypothetical protein
MTTKDQKKQQKKNARAKENRGKLLAKREAANIPVREERLFYRKCKRVNQLKNSLGKLNVWDNETLLSMSEKTLAQLEHNAKVLRALEDEYQQENAKKEALNEELESEGFYTLQEKLNSLQGKMVDHFTKSVVEAGIKPSEPEEEESDNFAAVNAKLDTLSGSGGMGGRREVSDVEVIKAPVFEEANQNFCSDT